VHFLNITSADQAWIAVSEKTGEDTFTGNLQYKVQNGPVTTIYPIKIDGTFRTNRIEQNNATGVTVFHGGPNGTLMIEQNMISNVQFTVTAFRNGTGTFSLTK
jgi:hypothetical protein